MPSDEQIETSAEAAYLGMRKRNKPWSMVSAWEKAEWRLATRAALEAAERKAWQPIESAPKDGAEVDLWCVDRHNNLQARVPDCRWGRLGPTNQMTWLGLAQRDRAWQPTHWRDVPRGPR